MVPLFEERPSSQSGVSRLERLNPSVKTGREPFHESGTARDFSLVDFWSWSMSDLVSNAARGVPFGFAMAHETDAGWGCSRDFHHVRSSAFTVNSLTGIFN